MKTTLLLALVCAFTFTASADKSVKGYTKKDGTYVAPYKKTDPNNRKDDNYSSKGNTNPYTGKKGYVDPNKDAGKTKKSDRF